EQRQHETPVRGGDEVVGVLDARRDPLQVDERADGIALEPGRQFLGGDAREYGHGAVLASALARPAESEPVDDPERDADAGVQALPRRARTVAEVLDQVVLGAGRGVDPHYALAVDDFFLDLFALAGLDAHRGLGRLFVDGAGRRRRKLGKRLELRRLLRRD